MTVRAALLLCLAIVFTLAAGAFAQEKKLTLTGMKIFTREELTAKLDLGRFEKNKLSAPDTIKALENFYKSAGYSLATLYVMKNDDKNLDLYIDEGELGKILFLKTDTLNLLWLRYKCRFKHGIFNSNQMQKHLRYLKRIRRYFGTTYEIKETKDYQKSLFQINRMLNIPVLGTAMTPFFDKYPPRYDLEITLRKKLLPESGNKETVQQRQGPTEKHSQVDIHLNIHYTKGFIPRIRFTRLGVFGENDIYSIVYSMGIMYGIDGTFDQPPTITFMSLRQNYQFSPFINGLFAPSLRADLYYSNASRADLKLLTYNYLLGNALLAQGINFLTRFQYYAGFGTEVVWFNQSRAMPDEVPYADLHERTDTYCYVETGLSVNELPILLGDPLKNYFMIIYDYYFMLQSFHLLRLEFEASFELGDMSIFSSHWRYGACWGSTPFHHEISVNSSSFKGFMGRSYYSRGAGSASHEILFSLYRDYLYMGLYCDITAFMGSGRDLEGMQYGVVGGPTVRLLVLDQLEFYLYYGWDYLLSSGESQQNINFNLHKKW